MKKIVLILLAGSMIATGCSKGNSATPAGSGYTCTCHYKVQYTGHDTTVATTYPSGTSQYQATSSCTALSQYYSGTYGDPTANCGL